MSSRRPRLVVSPKMKTKIGLTHRTIGGRRSINKRLGNAVVKASAAKIFAAASAACGVSVDTATQRGNIKVVVRVRPPNTRENAAAYKNVVVAVDEKLILFDPKEETGGFYYHGVKQTGNRDMLKKPHKDLKFCFDQVYGPQHSNAEIFTGTILPILDTILNGFNCSVFAYGATGAGKTYTMLGTPEYPGLTFLTVMELYRRLAQITEEYEHEVVVAYLEVYNETVRDLLNPGALGPLNVLENPSGVNIPNLSMHKPKDESQLLQMLADGNSLRTQHATDLNSESSRSHAVFQVFISLRSRYADMKTNVKVAKLVMIDLAGSERGSATGFQGARFREGASINKSLLALGNCINALADGKRHIPFRDSKLTRILKDSLGGNCKTVMIANVGPSDMSYEDTYNTLRYADRAKRIRFQVKKNILSVSACISKYGKVVEEMTEKIESLKRQLEDKENKCRCCVTKVDIATELSNSFCEMNEAHQSQSIEMETRPARPSTPVSTRPNLNETFTANSFCSSPSFSEFMDLLEKKRIIDQDNAKARNALNDARKKCTWQSKRIKLAEVMSSLDPLSNEKRLEKLKKQLESCVSQENLLNNHAKDSHQRTVEVNHAVSDAQCRVECMVKPDENLTTVTLQEFLNYKGMQRELDNLKVSEQHLQKTVADTKLEAMQGMEVAEQCINLLLPLFKIVRQNGQLTEDLEGKYNEIMTNLCGNKVHFDTKLKTPEEKMSYCDMVKVKPSLKFTSPTVKILGE